MVTTETITDNTPATIVNTGDADASEVLRARGITAYRNGDFDGAMADLDQAIQLNPKFAAAYIDRGIVLYRMQKFEKAFADIAHAKRIERTKAAKAGKKPRTLDPAIEMSVTPPPPPPSRRTARLYPREVGFHRPQQQVPYQGD